MAETTTTRLGLTRWGADTDTPGRTEFDGNFAALEAGAAMFAQGTRSARPTAGKAGRLYLVTGDAEATFNGLLFWDTGTTWLEVGQVLEQVVVRPGAPGANALTVQGLNGQTADLSVWKDFSGAVVGRITPAGVAIFNNLQASGGVDFTGVTNMTALTLSGALQGVSAAFSGALTGDFKSTSNRLDGQPKIVANRDGTGRHDGLIPPATVISTLRATEPPGWLFLHGQTNLDIATYPDLYEEIKTLPGVPGTTGKFNLPDFRGRTLMGADGTHTLGALAGSNTITLGVPNLPPHTHAIGHNHGAFSTGSGGGHDHTIPRRETSGGANDSTGRGGGDPAPTLNTGTNGAHSHSIDVPALPDSVLSKSTPAVGTQVPFPFEPRYVGVNYLIKT